jgi:hypothetical protein
VRVSLNGAVARGADLRRRAAVDGRRQHRLQPVGAWADPAARFARAGDDADQPFRPRRWRGAMLPAPVEVRFEILDHYKRPVSATADANEVRDVVEVTVRESRDADRDPAVRPEHNLEERILDEQFAY